MHFIYWITVAFFKVRDLSPGSWNTPCFNDWSYSIVLPISKPNLLLFCTSPNISHSYSVNIIISCFQNQICSGFFELECWFCFKYNFMSGCFGLWMYNFQELACYKMTETFISLVWLNESLRWKANISTTGACSHYVFQRSITEYLLETWDLNSAETSQNLEQWKVLKHKEMWPLGSQQQWIF